MTTDFTDLDLFFEVLGGNIILCYYKTKKSSGEWKHQQTNAQSLEEYDKLKQDNPLSNWGVITGKIWRGPYKDKYLVVIDLDNKKAIDEFISFSSENATIQTLAQKTIVVQHEDAIGERAHIYLITEKPITKRSGIHGFRNNDLKNEEIPSIEVKADSSTYVICPPSFTKNGYPYKIMGTKNILVLNEAATEKLEYVIDKIYQKYGSKKTLADQTDAPIRELFNPEFKIKEGNNRHLVLLRVMESLIQRFSDLLTEDEVKNYAWDWNQNHCKPPLEEKEFIKQWNDAKNFIFRSDSKNSNIKKKVQDNILSDDSLESIDTSLEKKLVDLVESRCIDIIIDQFHEVFVSVQISDHVETLPIDGNRFEKLIIKECYENNISQVNKDKIKNIVDIIKTKIEFASEVTKKTLSLRVARIGDNYVYDLANQKWEIIEITPEDWNVIPNSDPIFRRFKNNSSQVYPNKKYSESCIQRFFELLNIPGTKERLLLTAYIVSLFIPNIPKPILVIHGGKGAAKTTTFELIKKIVDPGIVDTLSFPKEANELIQVLSHSYVSYFDNISKIPDLLSDLLCRVVTGSGFSKRKLYTDDDDISYNFKRCIGINGINLASVKPDFLDRSIIIEVNSIHKKKRRKEQDIKNEFNQLLPDILGWIFDLLVKVLKYRKENPEKIKLQEYPRMADFAEFGEIIARCSGHQDGEFMNAYFENIDIQNDEVIEASLVAKTILEFMEDKESWSGSVTLLLNLLTDCLGDENERLKKSNSWITTPNVLSRRIKELEPTLNEKGIEIIRTYDNKKKSRVITITNVEKLSSLPLYRSNFSKDSEIAKGNDKPNY